MEGVFQIEPGDAIEKGLPPVRISIDLSNTAMMPYSYPDPKTYVSMSGPPGGPLFFIIKTIPDPITSSDQLQAVLTDMYRSANRPVPNFGQRGEITIQGKAYQSLLYFTGSSMAASASCAVVIPPPETGASSPGLLLIFGHGGTPDYVKTCAEIAEHPDLGEILRTISWDMAIDPNDRKKAEKYQPRTFSPRAPEPEPEPMEAPAPVAQSAQERDIIEIDPDDCEENELPRMRLILDITGSNMNPGLFLNPETYAFLSTGKGPQFFAILNPEEPFSSGAALEAFVQERNESSAVQFQVKDRGSVCIKGDDYPALLYTTTEHGTVHHNCAVFIPAPHGVESPGLLIMFGGVKFEGTVTFPEIRSIQPFDRLLDFMKWDFLLEDSESEETEDLDDDEEVDEDLVDDEVNDEGDETEEEEEVEEVRAPPGPQPTPATAVVLSKYLAEIREQIKAMGGWSDEMPTNESFQTWSQIKMQMWSLQSSIQAMENSIKHMIKDNPDAPVYGVVDGLKHMANMFTDPAANDLKALLQRGPLSMSGTGPEN